MPRKDEGQWTKAVRKRSANTKEGKAWRNHVAPNPPGEIRYLSKLDLAREKVAKAVEHLDKIAAVAGPILEREGYPPGAWIPDTLMTALVLSGREMDARWVKHYVAAKTALSVAYRAEHEALAESLRNPPPPPPRAKPSNSQIGYPKKPVKPAKPPVGLTLIGHAGLRKLPPPEPWHATVPPWQEPGNPA